MGIAHETANVYWVVNGDIGSLDRYDFVEDHGPGESDHSDGKLWRYAIGALDREPGTPSHLVFEPDAGTVLVSDTGNGRIVRFDPAGATEGSGITPYEPMALSVEMDGGTLTEVVPPGLLVSPSGIALGDGVFYVSDAATSLLHAFSLDGTLLRSLDTGLPAGSLAGIELRSDGVLYFVELPTSWVYLVDPTP
jgi:sugar lactone lactonase YvrE